MTQKSQDTEFNVLGCKVRHRPEENDSLQARAVIDLVQAEVEGLKKSRPTLRDTDVAVLVALKIATEKLQLEDEYKTNIFKLEESLETALQALSATAN
jgi:cell division protein ZapA (FtsZ GTPase activity inhibitor)